MKTKIKVEAKNAEKINTLINEVEGKASVRAINFTHIAMAVLRIEEHLESKNIPKKHWVGLSVDCDHHAQSFAKAYKYTPMSTHFRLERFSSGWFVVEVTRTICTPHKFDFAKCFPIYRELCARNIKSTF